MSKQATQTQIAAFYKKNNPYGHSFIDDIIDEAIPSGTTTTKHLNKIQATLDAEYLCSEEADAAYACLSGDYRNYGFASTKAKHIPMKKPKKPYLKNNRFAILATIHE